MINRIIKLLLSMSMIAVSFVMLDTPVFNLVTDVQADYYSMGCSNYEVAVANANGTFTKQACYNSFSEAQNAMGGYGENAVVRHNSSKSPTKIISMVGGIAVSYPMRSGKTTMNITQEHSSDKRKVTYVTKHREMKYDGTINYNGDGSGAIRVNITGFSGTTNLVDVDLVPYVFLGNNTTVWLGGNDTSGANEQPFNTHVYQSHYNVTQNGANKELTFYAYSGWSSDTWPAKYTMTVGLAADWMVAGTTYYSYDGYNFYSDNKYKNKVGTYYNYYQFLPTRTKSNVPASVFNQYTEEKRNGTSKMSGQGQSFINAQNTYGMNALLIYSLACLESGYGTSGYALERNNLFGWAAYDGDPNQAAYYNSVEEAINAHMGVNLRGYTNIDDPRFFGSHVGNKGSGFNVKYASDPYWGYKIAAIAYAVDKKAGFVDLNKYSVGVINTFGVNVLKSPNGATLFNSRYGETYQENFTVALLGTESNHYKIQSTNPVSGGNIVTGSTKGLVAYDWNQSVGYISTGYVNTIGGANITTPGTTPTGNAVNSISKFVVSGSNLTIEGKSYMPGIYVTDENKITQALTIYDDLFNKKTLPLNTNITNNDVASFSGTIDLKSLTVGEYYFQISSAYSKYSSYNQLFNIGNGLVAPTKVEIDGKSYLFALDSNIMFLKVEKLATTTPTPTPTVAPTPTPSPTVIPQTLKHEVLDFKRSENVLDINGFAFITGINADDKAEITQEIYYLNLETNETIPFNVITSSSNAISLGDGYNYSKVYFKGSLDITDLPAGNYALYIKVKNGNVEKKSEVVNYYTTTNPENITNGDIPVNFLLNSSFSYRYELRKEKLNIDNNLIVKPNDNPSIFDFTLFTMKDGKLLFDVVAWISGVDTIKNNSPKYLISFVDKTQKIDKEVVNYGCPTDIAKSMGYKYSSAYACTKGEINLADIPNGEYVIMIDMTVGKYREIMETYDYYSRVNQKVTFNGKVYELTISPIRSRLMLSITDEVKNASTTDKPTTDANTQLSDTPSKNLMQEMTPVGGNENTTKE